MIQALLAKLFGSRNDRVLKRLQPAVDRINVFEPGLKALSDEQLKAKTAEFRERHAKGETLDALLPEAFAVAREAARRALGLRPFDVQLMGGMVLHEGKISEMRTGEGKTLVASLPLYLHAIAGKGAHLVTVNEYLAERDSKGMGNFKGMGNIYEFLGLSVGYIKHDMNPEARRKAYAADITYGTVSEFGFDYLRDNMAPNKESQVQRGHAFAIVDEVDSILIDEARTPLIISGPADESTDRYAEVDRIIPRFEKETDYTVDEKHRNVVMTEAGVAKAENLLGVKNLYDLDQMEALHHVTQALKAHVIFHRDVDYVVNNGEVVLVDEFTGRLMPGRRYSDGLHQALEAKERVKVERENQTLATITIQNYFRMYARLAGMTGTADTEAEEFGEIYKLEVVVVPTHRPMVRLDNGDSVYKTRREKLDAVLEEIKETVGRGQPILVGTVSIEKNEELSKFLNSKGVKHQLLNAKNHEREAEIILLAGQKEAVTVATNMAGRGTDIQLGEGVRELGGLKIIGTERHESRRIDNQLRGRAGRQGDPGESRFYVALDDDLMRIFGSERLQKWMERFGLQEGEVIEHPWVSKAIARAQKKVEEYNFDVRKHLLEYDDVMNKQRTVIYSERQSILDGSDMKSHIEEMLLDAAEDAVEIGCPPKSKRSDWDLKGLETWVQNLTGVGLPPERELPETREGLLHILKEKMREAYAKREADMGPEMLRRLERFVLLNEIDTNWKDHLYAMDRLREGIGLMGYGQLDPLVEYKKEGFSMFQAMIGRVKEQTLKVLFHIQRAPEEELPATRSVFHEAAALHPDYREAPASRTVGAGAGLASPFGPIPSTGSGFGPPPGTAADFASAQAAGGKVEPIRRDEPRIGRNDPCYCGSGKKYKKCHGA